MDNIKPVLWEKLDRDYVKCNICHNRCIIAPGCTSRCFSRKNIEGEMELNTFGMISSLAVDPIEKKPLYHFHPGTKVFSVGGWGCNFTCLHCQNWNISQPEIVETTTGIKQTSGVGGYCVSPEQLVNLAVENNCQGLSWTYNEPVIWLEYTIESAKLAKEQGLYTAYVTNGYITTEALEIIAPYLDAYRVDLKSFSDEFYREISGVKNALGIYESAIRAKEFGLYIETVTNIIPSKNDSDEDLRNIASWIVKNLGTDTPWHVSRFFPYNKLNNLPPTPLETIEKAVQIGKAEGLNFIYKGNVGEKSYTICPDCKTIAIERNQNVRMNIGKNGKCINCNRDLNIII